MTQVLFFVGLVNALTAVYYVFQNNYPAAIYFTLWYVICTTQSKGE